MGQASGRQPALPHMCRRTLYTAVSAAALTCLMYFSSSGPYWHVGSSLNQNASLLDWLQANGSGEERATRQPAQQLQLCYYLYRREHLQRLESATAARATGLNDSNATSKCAVIPPGLVGNIPVYQFPVRLDDLESLNFSLQPGGHFEPSYCQPQCLVAIVIPFRGRWEHLTQWLLHMHPFLQRQELGYTVYVINQEEGSQFNRGMLMNIGYIEALKLRSYDCFVFHDVDLLPENDRNLYTCPYAPRHMSVAIDKFGYRLPYADIAGGVVAINTKDFEKLNGFSNLFFGWGGEDDDLSYRIQASGLRLTRYKPTTAKYKMFKHSTDAGNEANPLRYQLLRQSKERLLQDGLTTIAYSVKNIRLRKLFTWVSVAFDQGSIYSQSSTASSQ